MDDRPTIPEGCEACPNRQQRNDKATGKWAAYFFALFLCGLMVAFCFEEKDDSDGSPRLGLKSDPPIGLMAILLPAIGAGLGVQLSPELIGVAINKVTGKS